MRGVILIAVAIAGTAGPAGAEDVVVRGGDGRAAPRRLALGVEVGEPSSIAVRVGLGDRVALSAAVGTGTLAGIGPSLRADVTVTAVSLAAGRSSTVPLHLGVGVRHYRHGYAVMSVDELPDAHSGVRMPVGATWLRAGSAVAFYVEAAPGLDLVRTASCSYASRASTVCPHAQASPFFVDAVAGVRWYLR